jgi:hypothetical protein
MRAHTLGMGFGLYYIRYDIWDLRCEGRHVRNGIWDTLNEIRHIG